MLSRLSPRVRMLLTLVLAVSAVLVLLRIGFLLYFLRPQAEMHGDALSQAFWIGVRFDLRLALLVMLPVAVISFLPWPLRLRDSRIAGALMIAWLVLASLGLSLFYIADFAHFAYLGERINVTVLEFFKDQRDSMAMVWQTYPVVRLLLVLAVMGFVGYRFARFLLNRYRSQPWPEYRWYTRLAIVGVCVALFCVGIIGKVTSVVPLRWSNAFFSGNVQISSLGLNPVVYFFDTYTNQGKSFDREKVAEHYDQIASYLGVTERDPENLSFVRQVPGNDSGRRPNVVFIMLESLGANRLGLYGNPTGATPHLDALAKNDSLFFPRFMVPASGTARTVFGIVTSIPDVAWGGSTSSRNPLIIDQYTLVNEFKDYHKLYFIGGDAGWANIRGLLEHNIDGLELWEQKDYDAPTVDVWGISDRELFKAAHKRASEAAKDGPFVMFIQTAANHRPYTIPVDDSGFEYKTPDMDWLGKYTWQDHGQYNAARLLDFNINFYLNELVPGSAYDGNTIFVLYGDHNTRGTFGQHMGWTEHLGLDGYHVPLIIHAPGLIDEAREMEMNASLVDILPTTLALAGLPYENRTMGRNLLQADPDWNYVTVFGGDRSVRPYIGLVGPEHYLQMYYDGDQARLYSQIEPSLENELSEALPEKKAELKSLLEGLYETQRYMLYHNKK
ncbi:LTA synthase family protein [Isoalcanivorax pacificus]|nr:alkaline phosphatase family protein [Isoalcanivorax pacificus]